MEYDLPPLYLYQYIYECLSICIYICVFSLSHKRLDSKYTHKGWLVRFQSELLIMVDSKKRKRKGKRYYLSFIEWGRVLQFCPRFGRGRHENSPIRVDQPPSKRTSIRIKRAGHVGGDIVLPPVGPVLVASPRTESSNRPSSQIAEQLVCLLYIQ